MSMSKQDFIDLADQWREHRAVNYNEERPDRLLVDFEDFLIGFCRSQNPRFNSDRWLGYLNGKCGPNGGKPKGKAK